MKDREYVVNPFVSEAQRRACYAKDDPDWDCKEWSDATKKEGRKLPFARKSQTHNGRTVAISAAKKGLRKNRKTSGSGAPNPLRQGSGPRKATAQFIQGALAAYDEHRVHPTLYSQSAADPASSLRLSGAREEFLRSLLADGAVQHRIMTLGSVPANRAYAEGFMLATIRLTPMALPLSPVTHSNPDQPHDEKGRFTSSGEHTETHEKWQEHDLDHDLAHEGKVEKVEARRESGLEKLSTKHEKEDDKVESTREKEDEKLEKVRDKEDTSIDKARDKEVAGHDKDHEARQKAIDKSRDKGEADIEKERKTAHVEAKKRGATEDEHDAIDSVHDDRLSDHHTKHDELDYAHTVKGADVEAERTTRYEAEDKALESRRASEDASTESRRKTEDGARDHAQKSEIDAHHKAHDEEVESLERAHYASRAALYHSRKAESPEAHAEYYTDEDHARYGATH